MQLSISFKYICRQLITMDYAVPLTFSTVAITDVFGSLWRYCRYLVIKFTYSLKVTFVIPPVAPCYLMWLMKHILRKRNTFWQLYFNVANFLILYALSILKHCIEKIFVYRFLQTIQSPLYKTSHESLSRSSVANTSWLKDFVLFLCLQHTQRPPPPAPSYTYTHTHNLLVNSLLNFII